MPRPDKSAVADRSSHQPTARAALYGTLEGSLEGVATGTRIVLDDGVKATELVFQNAGADGSHGRSFDPERGQADGMLHRVLERLHEGRDGLVQLLRRASRALDRLDDARPDGVAVLVLADLDEPQFEVADRPLVGYAALGQREGATAEVQLGDNAKLFPSDAALASWMAQAHNGQSQIIYE